MNRKKWETKHYHLNQGRSQDLVSGGGHPFRGGGPTPYFSPQTPNHKGPPLCTFGYLRISGGGPSPPPGYALDSELRLVQLLYLQHDSLRIY